MDRSNTEVNTYAWTEADKARRVIQRNRSVDIGSDGTGARHYEASKAAQEVRHATDAGFRQADPEHFDRGSLEERIARLGARPIAEQMRERMVGSQAPEPVMEVVGPAGPEGAKVTRLWAVDDAEFDKHAGDPMTDEEYAAVCRRMKPVHWDKHGVPDQYASAHDVIDPEEGLARRVPTRRERAQAAQYAVRGLASEGMGGDHIRDTDHTILPEPYVEPVDPDLP